MQLEFCLICGSRGEQPRFAEPSSLAIIFPLSDDAVAMT